MLPCRLWETAKRQRKWGMQLRNNRKRQGNRFSPRASGRCTALFLPWFRTNGTILSFWHPELRINLCCFRPPSLWSFVTVSIANEFKDPAVYLGKSKLPKRAWAQLDNGAATATRNGWSHRAGWSGRGRSDTRSHAPITNRADGRRASQHVGSGDRRKMWAQLERRDWGVVIFQKPRRNVKKLVFPPSPWTLISPFILALHGQWQRTLSAEL